MYAKPEDIHGFFASQAILTSRGGKTAHAAVVARGMGKCCVAGAEGIHVDVDRRIAIVGDTSFKEGDHKPQTPEPVRRPLPGPPASRVEIVGGPIERHEDCHVPEREESGLDHNSGHGRRSLPLATGGPLLAFAGTRAPFWA